MAWKNVNFIVFYEVTYNLKAVCNMTQNLPVYTHTHTHTHTHTRKKEKPREKTRVSKYQHY